MPVLFTLIINSVFSIHSAVGCGSKLKVNALKYGSNISGHAANALMVSSWTKGQPREPVSESKKCRITGLLDLTRGIRMRKHHDPTHPIVYMYMYMIVQGLA